VKKGAGWREGDKAGIEQKGTYSEVVNMGRHQQGGGKGVRTRKRERRNVRKKERGDEADNEERERKGGRG